MAYVNVNNVDMIVTMAGIEILGKQGNELEIEVKALVKFVEEYEEHGTNVYTDIKANITIDKIKNPNTYHINDSHWGIVIENPIELKLNRMYISEVENYREIRNDKIIDQFLYQIFRNPIIRKADQ